MKKILSIITLMLIGISLTSVTFASSPSSGVENFSLGFKAENYLDASDACFIDANGGYKDKASCNTEFYDSMNNLFNFAILIVFLVLVAKILMKLAGGGDDKGGGMGGMGGFGGGGEDMFSFKKLMGKIGIEVGALVILFALAFGIVADIKTFVGYVRKVFNNAVQVAPGGIKNTGPSVTTGTPGASSGATTTKTNCDPLIDPTCTP